MAKINPVKVKQEADKEEKAGRFEKAIELFKQLVADNPRDWNTIKEFVDRQAWTGFVAPTKENDFFLVGPGPDVKAIALWKWIQKLNPAALEPHVQMA